MGFPAPLCKNDIKGLGGGYYIFPFVNKLTNCLSLRFTLVLATNYYPYKELLKISLSVFSSISFHNMLDFHIFLT